jgi:hypothetical protein
MDNDKMPEPVAWRCNWNKSGEIAWVQYHDETDPLPEKWDAPPNETLPLYSAETVQALQAEANEQARLNGMGAEREARLMAQVAELQAEVNDLARRLCLSAEHEIATNRHVYQMEIERDALAKDAGRYRWLRDGGLYRVGFDSTGAVSLYMLDSAIAAAMSEGER